MNANNVQILHGRLTRTPELKTGGNGNEYCRFTVAVDRYNGKDKETDFFNCTAFGKTGAAINQYMEKGKEIIVVGSMESRTTGEGEDKKTYWGMKVDAFGFCGSKGQAATDPQSGMAVVSPDDDPFA